MTAQAVQNVKRRSSSVAEGLSAAQERQVEEITRRVDYAKETRMFHKIVALVAAGMLMDSIDVDIGSAVASSSLSTHWSTVAQNSTFMSAGFLGLLIGSLLAGFIGDLKGRRVAYQINLLLFGGFTFLGAFAPNMSVLSLCRLGAGLGLGAEIVTGFAMVMRDCVLGGELRRAGRHAVVRVDHSALVVASAVRRHRHHRCRDLVAAS